MSFSAAQWKMVQRIVNMPGAPNIVHPTGGSKPLPRYVIQNAGGRARPMGLSLTTDASPEIVVRVETNAEGSAAESADLVQRLEALFPRGLRFDGITIEDAPLPRPPLTDTGVYAVPVIIRGRTFY